MRPLAASLRSPSVATSQAPADPYHQYQQGVWTDADRHLTAGAGDSLAVVVRGYIADERFNPSVGHQLAGVLCLGEGHLDLAATLVEAGLTRNAAEALGLISPEMASPVKVDQLNLNLYSRRAWIEWKTGRTSVAQEQMRRALYLARRHLWTHRLLPSRICPG